MGLRKKMLHWPAIAAAIIAIGSVSWLLLVNGQRLDTKDQFNPILIPAGNPSAAPSDSAGDIQTVPQVLPQSSPLASSTIPIDQAEQPRVAEQTRDTEWAGKTESDIGSALHTIPALASSTPLDVRCGATVCEARGKLRTDASAYNRAQAAEYLRGSGFVDALGKANALTDKVVFSEETGQFIIYFSRVRK
ncbi:hypothetical protein [Sphingobium sp. SA916]|uniref:hypothetical protein n=1 Tax=Sphingobium sp. SA916 TaxID=1851207 RepID=UPI0011AED8A5|nr:hypothetical protein [Sphingobium sp. SA916]